MEFEAETDGIVEAVADTYYTYHTRMSDAPANYCFVTSVSEHFVYMLFWDRDSSFDSCTNQVLNRHTSFQRVIRGTVKDEVNAIIADLALLD